MDGSADWQACLIELCDSGLITCTNGQPGSSTATYALAWLPLDSAEDFTQAVRELHTENMQRFADGVHSPAIHDLQKRAQKLINIKGKLN